MAVAQDIRGSAVSDEQQKGSAPGEGAEKLSREAAKDIAVVAKGGAIQVVGQISQRSLSFFFGLVATRFLGFAGYGLYRLVSQTVANLAQLGLLGFNYASMRFISRARARGEHGEVRGAMRVGITAVLVVSAIVTVITLLATEPIADFFTERDDKLDELAELLRVATPYIALYAMMQVLRYCTQAYKTMVPSVTVGNIVQPAVRFVVGVGVLVAGADLVGVLWTLNLSVAVAVVVAVWWLRRMLTEAERSAKPSYPVGPMFRFALPQAGASLLGIQTLGLGLLVLGRYQPDLQVGIFAVALQLQGPGNVFLGGIVNIWAPVVSDLYDRGEIARLQSLYQTINRWIATFSFPVFAALILEGDVFVELFGGRVPPSAATVVAILALGNIFYTGTGPTGYVISMTGHPGVNFINSIIAVALYVVLGAWIVPTHGVIGMAWIDTGVTALINTVRVVQAKLLVGVQPFGRTFYKPVVATLVGAGVLLLWRLIPGDNVWLDASGIIAGAAAYIAALKMLGIDEEERHVLNRIKKRALKRR